MPRYDVFLSHASADKPAVELLARKLREAGIEPFLDKWRLIPGESWQEGVEEALRQSRTCAVFIGRELGPWQNEEMRAALAKRVKNRTFRVIPVLLSGGPESGLEDLSEFLGRLTWVDFRNDPNDQDEFDRFLAGIRGEEPGPGKGIPPLPYRCMAPAREPFVQRSEYAKVRDALLVPPDGVDNSGHATTVGITAAIHGAGGFGKTALAIELCYDEQVRERYPDGILWVQMRDTLDDDGRLKEIRDVLRLWVKEEPPAFETVAKAGQRLIELLNGKRVLLVVDDVWNSADLSPFQGLSSEATLLITTRDSRTFPRGTVLVHVDSMETSEAVRLLGAGLLEGVEADLKSLAQRLGEWPLLLKLANRQVEDWIGKGLNPPEAIRKAEEALEAKGLTYFDPNDAKDRSQAATLTLEVSLERLPKEDQKRFAELAIFAENANVPFSVLEKLWQLDSFEVEKIIVRLFDLSLIRNLDLHSGTLRLHDVIRAYLLKKGESQLPVWNQRLLKAYSPANGCWSELARKESYLWRHLIHHLMGAGYSDICRDLLLDFQYLRSKLGATDINALLADYSSFANKDQELQLVQDALRLSAHVLARDSVELREQLWGRLLSRQEAGIRRLLQASEGSGAPWLRPRKASLTQPGGPLIRSIDHPGIPEALAVLPDGRVVSASDDDMLRVWNIENGRLLKVLKGHSSTVNAVAVLDSRRVVSSSDDWTLRVWDVENEQTIQILQSFLRVKAVAVLDSRRVVSTYAENVLMVWDVESGHVLQVLRGHSNYINTVIALDSRRVISGSADRTMRMWDVETGQILRVFQGGPEIIAIAAVDSRRVVSGASDGALRVWDLKSGEILQILKGRQSSWIDTVAALDNRQVVSGASDGALRVWDLESGQVVQTLKGQSRSVTALAVFDNRQVVSGSPGQRLQVWDLERGPALKVLEGHSDSVCAVAVLDNHRVVSGSADRTLRVWDSESGQVLKVLEGHSDEVCAVAVLDSHRVVSGSADRTLRVWDLESGQVLKVLKGHSNEVRAVAMLDSPRIVSLSRDKSLRVWDVESGKTLNVLYGGLSGMECNLVALDSHRVVSDHSIDALQVWDVESGNTLQVLKERGVWIHALAVWDSYRVGFNHKAQGNRHQSPCASTWDVLDSRRVLFNSSGAGLGIWDVKSGQALHVLEGHFKGVSTLAVWGSRRVVSGSSDDRTLRVWDIGNEEGECLFTLDAPVTAVAVIPDRNIIVAGDTLGHVHFFDFVESLGDSK